MSFRKAYDPYLFAEVSQMVVREVTRHLEAQTKPPYAYVAPNPPQKLVERAAEFLNSSARFVAQNEGINGEPLDRHITERALQLVQDFIANSTHLHSPHYMGHQVNPPMPLVGAFAGMGATLNPGLAIYEMSRYALAIEKALIDKLNKFVNWQCAEGTRSGGIVTSGGTLANLTAILSARNWKFPDAFTQGLGNRRPALLTSAESHYSVSRAAGVIGIGSDQVIQVDIDSKRRMDPQALEKAYSEAVAKGLEPFCVVATSGTTPIGAFDPLEEIADFTEEKNLWLHVDGAHGGAFLMSPTHQHLLKGVGRADSLTWDAHKMMYVPSLCTFLLYRDAQNSYLPFQQEAPYLFSPTNESAQSPEALEAKLVVETGLRTFECTKGPLTLPLWALWSLFSEKVFIDLMDKVVATTQACYRIVNESKDFTALHEPECNIFCFRYTPEGKNMSAKLMDEFQRKVRDAAIADGKFFITGTNVDDIYSLRVTIMNPAVEPDHFIAFLDRIRGLQSFTAE